jgi:phage terminase large subunit
MSKKERIAPTAVAASLADHFTSITVEKWERGMPQEEINLKRYQGWVPVYDEKGQPVEWREPTPESLAEGALLFMREVTGFKPRPYQEDIVRRLCKHRRVAVRAPRKAGKSAIAANIVIWFLTIHEVCKVPTTAGAWAQLEEFLWPEICLWAGRADWSLVGKKPKVNLLDMSFGGSEDGLVKPTSRAFAIRSDEPEKMEGAHSENVLALLDEAKKIEDATFDAIEGTLAGEGTYALVVSTPGGPSGRFHEFFSDREKHADWNIRAITFEEQVAGRKEGPERDSYVAWAEARKRQWGENSPMYRNHVLGEFADTDDNCIIPPEWVEDAVDRWKRWRDEGFPETDEWVGDTRIRCQGVDVAGQGKDNTAVAFRIGCGIKEILSDPRDDTMQTALKVMARTLRYPVVRIEVDGVGTGPYDRLCQIKKEDADSEKPCYDGVIIQAVTSGSKSEALDATEELGFFNKRSEMWWRLREALDPATGSRVMLPDHPQLLKELAMPLWELRDGKPPKIKVEAKAEIRKRLKGKSTDHADAVIFAFADDTTVVVAQTIRLKAEDPKKPGRTFYDTPSRRQWPGYGGRRRI